MSGIHEEIARLTGKLVFDVSTGPLSRFMQLLKAAEQQMASVGKQAEALQKKLNMKFGVTAARSEKLKIDASVQQSFTKQLATEAKLSKLRRQQFATQLAEQKLVSAGKREEAFLQSASLKDQVQRAVLAAKQHAAEQASLKTELGKARVQATVEQSKIREARLADILQRRAERTVKLQQQAASHATAMQRAELAMTAARQRGERMAEKYAQSKQAARLREERAAVRADQQTKRFDFAAERHEAWKAKQAEPEAMGFGGLTVGLGAAAAGLYGLVSAVGYLNRRIELRQETAADNQQFDNTLLAAGNNEKERARIKEAYISNSQEYGMKIDRESAVAYSNMIQGFRAQGKTLEEAIQLQKDQAAVFRIGNLDKTQQYSAALQLNQGYSKDRFMGQDLRPLTDALGTRLTTILYQAIGKALGYKGDQNKLAGFVLEAQHDGKVNGAMVQQGLRDIVAQSPELLERHKHSLDAQAVRLENDRYLQGENVNRDPELIAALGDRLTAERELTEALRPLKDSLMEFDKGLTKFNTNLIRWMIGHNADGTAAATAMQKDPNPAPGTVGTALGPRLKPDTPETEQERLDSRATSGFFGNLRRFLTGGSVSDDQSAADENRERWGGRKLKISPVVETGNFDAFFLRLDKFATQLSESMGDESNQWHRFRVPEGFDASEAMQRADSINNPHAYYPEYASVKEQTNSASSAGQTAQQSNSNNTVHIEPTTVNVTINADKLGDPKQLAEAVGPVVKDIVDQRFSNILRETGVNQTEVQ
ncbi:hypothetical protein [Pseudomonas fluorescens]|uniref:hypothetical protein n=1 Tax=Pseudomonas fluorescens TaxID=294 RepID=UPI0037FD1AD0